jgi:hypothetical protein
MKNSISYGLLAITAALAMNLSACSKDSGSSSSGSSASTFAATPQPCNLNGVNAGYNNGYYPNGYNNGYQNGYNGYNNGYTNQQYDPYYNNTTNCNTYPNGIAPGTAGYNSWNYGAWTYPNQWQPNTANCGCPIGYRTVYTAGYGIACAPTAYFNNSYTVNWNWNWSWGSPQNNQWVNTPQNYYTGGNASCMDQTARGCDTRAQNCGSGYFCQAAGGGSVMGLCVRQ